MNLFDKNDHKLYEKKTVVDMDKKRQNVGQLVTLGGYVISTKHMYWTLFDKV